MLENAEIYLKGYADDVLVTDDIIKNMFVFPPSFQASDVAVSMKEVIIRNPVTIKERIKSQQFK